MFFTLLFDTCTAIIGTSPGVAQLVARLLWEQDAAGSNPVTRTKKTDSLEGIRFLVYCLFPALAHFIIAIMLAGVLEAAHRAAPVKDEKFCHNVTFLFVFGLPGNFTRH